MAGLRCFGLDDELTDAVAWQCGRYSDAWKSLVTEEVHSVYGVYEPSVQQKSDLLASGTCIFDVYFEAVPWSPTHVIGRFPVSGDGVGRKFLDRPPGEPSVAVISTTHPDWDLVAQAHFVSLQTRGDPDQGALELTLDQRDVSAVLAANRSLRVDLQFAWVSLSRQTEALGNFCAQRGPAPTRLQYLVCGKVGTTLERRYINDHRAGVSRHLQTILGYRNHGL